MSTHSSPARILANQENAQLSTGPITVEGKAKASLNAVTTALTGRTVLLPSDTLAAYQQHLDTFQQKFQPGTPDETTLVQALADTDWRLGRIPCLLFALQAKAQEEFREQWKDLDAAARSLCIELETYLKYEKQIRNLELQENRLHKRREKDIAELRSLQQERADRRAKELAAAAQLYSVAQRDNQSFHPADHGFEFSIEDVQRYMQGKRSFAQTETARYAPITG